MNTLEEVEEVEEVEENEENSENDFVEEFQKVNLGKK